jgi:Alr-MurF fusion protein
MNFSELEEITRGRTLLQAHNRRITYLLTDSRKAFPSEESLFFAILGPRHDGHQYIPSLYQSGIRQFVIEKNIDVSPYLGANFLLVRSSIGALQAITAFHRKVFSIPVIGITGSNGKTIIKEWLYQLTSPNYPIVKNPGSYNSQIGVPLSVWQIQPHHQLGVFEAGISQPGEMDKLQPIIQPSIGLFTNIGSAHDQGFSTREEKIKEKIKLFRDADVIIYCKDHQESALLIEQVFSNKKLSSWGESELANVQIRVRKNISEITWRDKTHLLSTPFTDQASIENLHHCIIVLFHLGFSFDQIQERLLQLKTIPMRMELKQGINNCQIIDDTYNNDLGGLQISLDFLAGQQKKNKTAVLSDVLQSGLKEDELIMRIENLVIKAGVTSLVLVGQMFSTRINEWRKFKGNICAYASTEHFISTLNRKNFQNEIILIKGARDFRFERIVKLLQNKIHGTIMEVDLGAMVYNLNYFKSKLKPNVKLMAMVKAFAYGSGSEEVANLLQYHQVDYLGVAYTDEGIDLRKKHITLPIMIMSPSEEGFAALLEYNLEPEIYNLRILNSFTRFLNGRSAKIHFKLETGMHRLGFDETELKEAIELLKLYPNISIASVFSHVAGADESAHDNFTREQSTLFNKLSSYLMSELKVSPVRHLINTSGILRFPELQFDMVRLGIGLYGIDPTETKEQSLQPVATLKSVISQIKKIKAGESIGYGRKGRAKKDIKIATVAIGYADGYSRAFSQGKGVMWLNGQVAPVIGNVCMDMTMIDITHIDAREGDEVILFGKELPIYDVASRCNTIPYEILTNTSERVKRVFWTEGI